MKTNFLRRKAALLVMFAFIISANWSCKENTILPKNLVPAVDNINTFDTTFDLITHTIYQDSFLTGGKLSGLQISSTNTYYTACGAIQADPSFGSTLASMHVEVLPAVPNFTFKTSTANMKIDSVVLSVPYKISFGDTSFSSIKQTFNLYRSLKRFSRDSTQFEFTKDSVDHGNLLSALNVNFATLYSDSVVVAGVKQQPQLRFKLAPWFMDSLKAQVDLAANGATSSFANFLNWWNGFAIEPSSTKGNTLGYFDTYRTKLTMYYRYTKTTGGEDTVLDVFSFDPYNCNRFNSITHNYTSSQSNKFIKTNSVQGDSLLFLQNEPGLVNVFHMPAVLNLPNVIVNKAELVFTLAPSQNFHDTLIYKMIPRLQIFRTDTAGNNDLVATDYGAFGSSAYVDGKISKTTINGTDYYQYKFIVSNSIQKVISQKDANFRFKIMGANLGFPAAYRSILSGSASQDLIAKPKLNLIYTIINK